MIFKCSSSRFDITAECLLGSQVCYGLPSKWGNKMIATASLLNVWTRMSQDSYCSMTLRKLEYMYSWRVFAYFKIQPLLFTER